VWYDRIKIEKGGRTMDAALRTPQREDVMTDYQFRTIIKMVLGIARKTDDVKEIIEELEKLLPESDRKEE
jgi:mannitol/fructose-specific phosphotransferase system IIA component